LEGLQEVLPQDLKGFLRAFLQRVKCRYRGQFLLSHIRDIQGDEDLRR
jgi:hypothetical protein